ncbi:MAG: protein kinase [Prevotella sp.]|nr:protein kinase [Prevotella sp.]
MKLEEGHIIAEHYKLLKQLGHGSFGDVWLAHNLLADIDVAIKFYGTFDMKGLDEFRNEFKMAYQLHHPNLLSISHFDVCDNCPYLVMPYCANGSVSSRVGKMSEDEIWKFVLDVSSGLAFLHSLQPPIIHQDIKPDNILITSDGRYVISDFGISRSMRTKMSKSANDMGSSGTIAYMGPERFSEMPVIVLASDVWAFGMTLYELMNGDILWEGMGGCVQLNGARMPVIDKRYSAALANLVISCLAAETWDRPTAEQIHEYASAFIHQKPLPPIMPKTVEKPKSLFQPESYYGHQQPQLRSERQNIRERRQAMKPVVTHNDILDSSVFENLNWKKIAAVAAAIVFGISLITGGVKYYNVVSEEQEFVSCQTIQDYEKFIKNYPSSSYVETARKRINDLRPAVSAGAQPVPEPQPAPEQLEKPEQKIQQAATLQEVVPEKAIGKKNTNSVVTSARSSSSTYNSDDRAFFSCVTAKDYHNYLKQFPNGRHREQATNALTVLVNSQGANEAPTNRVIERQPRMRSGRPSVHRAPRPGFGGPRSRPHP